MCFNNVGGLLKNTGKGYNDWQSLKGIVGGDGNG